MNVNVVERSSSMNDVQVASVVSRRQDSQREKVREEAAAGSEHVRRMIAEMQQQIDRMNVSLQFSTYGENGEKIAIVVTDKESGEVIREIPSKEIQNLYAKMSELAGMIFNRQV
jgi:flagellar protein FlaG